MTAVTDLPAGAGGLPPSDVLTYHLPGARVVIRPSGTEPKLKAYLEVIEPAGGRSLADGAGRRRRAPGAAARRGRRPGGLGRGRGWGRIAIMTGMASLVLYAGAPKATAAFCREINQRGHRPGS